MGGVPPADWIQCRRYAIVLSMKRILIATMIVFLCPVNAYSIQTGQLIRVTHSAFDTRVVGTVVARDPDNVTIRKWKSGDKVTLRIADISSVEKRTGTKTKAEAGALVGGAAGLVIGLMFANDESEQRFGGRVRTIEDPDKHITGIVVSTIVFAGVGLLIGAGMTSETWQSVSVAEMKLGATWHGNKLGIALSLRF
jgi:hypothetical protein